MRFPIFYFLTQNFGLSASFDSFFIWCQIYDTWSVVGSFIGYRLISANIVVKIIIVMVISYLAGQRLRNLTGSELHVVGCATVAAEVLRRRVVLDLHGGRRLAVPASTHTCTEYKRKRRFMFVFITEQYRVKFHYYIFVETGVCYKGNLDNKYGWSISAHFRNFQVGVIILDNTLLVSRK